MFKSKVGNSHKLPVNFDWRNNKLYVVLSENPHHLGHHTGIHLSQGLSLLSDVLQKLLLLMFDFWPGLLQQFT